MAITVKPWDGETYAANTFDDIFRVALNGDDQATRCVLPGVDGEFVVSGTSSPVAVAAGAAIVNGKVIISTASENVVVPTPSGDTRIDCIVLEVDYALATADAAIVRVAGSEGGAAPSVTQTDGTKWQTKIAEVSITTGGVITVTNSDCKLKFPTSYNVDDSTIEVSSNALRLKDTGTTNAKLAASCKRMKGEIIMWSGSLGTGGNAHFPVDPDTSAANANWHICNGDTQNSVVTPNLADKFVICAGSTYAAAATGGAATKNLAHTHEEGTLAAANESAHTHAGGTYTTGAGSAHNHSNPNTGAMVGGTSLDISAGIGSISVDDHTHTQGATGTEAAHTHTSFTGASAAGSAHTHTIDGATASGGSATQDIMPPYYALVFLCYVGS